ncbi:MAG: ribonucleoside-diphosphate reductase subunit alpha [Candidatus Aenigmarchaeota archaeon]|nr:ribonucleoside-diphosphate reductase subunit alpha [Candidatus Aenigmarchaeota archaeon]
MQALRTGQLMVVKRSGEIVDFDQVRISNAVLKAVRASGQELAQEQLDGLMADITGEIEQRFVDFYPNVENIQDIVEKHLVKRGHYEISKAYILYRANRQKEREEQRSLNLEKARLGKLKVRKRNGSIALFDVNRITETIRRAADGLVGISADLVSKEAVRNIYDGVTTEEIEKALVLATASFIERDPAYSYLASRFYLQKIYKEVIGRSITADILDIAYRETFVRGIKAGVEHGLLDRRMLDFDLKRLAENLAVERDLLFQYLGIQTLYERYLLKTESRRIEMPQSFWMRVAMGLAIEEPDRDARAVEFYEILSALRYVPSTPTLFHSGTMHPQLSSCYLTTVSDDLNHIFKCLGDNAQLSKWSGGLGNDWTSIRATGSRINSTNVESQGVIPFLKIANDVTTAINRSGKRRGATCAYLETWHLDIEDFLDLRRNTGDERRRTHDMNTANWIPDLFMKRVLANGSWTLFSPDEVPELHHLYGRRFEEKYLEYEKAAREGKVRRHKTMPAADLWKKMLSRLFETGHPWITFKDPCNIRSPQEHVGIIHSSNLCTEITLNTSPEETAVCNLGSVNLERHIIDGALDRELLAGTVKLAIRMLDNVIDINYYPTKEAKDSNLRHRPIGLGIMGFHDALFKLGINFDSKEAEVFADVSMEFVAYHAILASSELAKEKGTYPSYIGSKWDRGIFPADTLQLLEDERGVAIEVSREQALDWSVVREHVKKYGMRNSNTMAIAPTATISNIAGCLPCIEPIYENIYVKSNISGEFTVINSYLIEDLKRLGIWNPDTLDQLKFHGGNLQLIAGIPDQLRSKYLTAFEIEPERMIDIAAARGKWIDQSQSLNIFYQGSSGKRLSEIYTYAWRKGLKTTYYLRTLAASQIEKATIDPNKFGHTQIRPAETAASAPNVCSINDPNCEACQ